MNNKGTAESTNKDNTQYELSYNPLYEKVDALSFRIKINVELRRLGVKDIIIRDGELLIRSRDDIIVHVTGYEEHTDLVGEIEDQLLEKDDDQFLSAGYIKKIINFIDKRNQIITEINDYFKDKKQSCDLRDCYPRRGSK